MIQLSIEVADRPGELSRIVGLMAQKQIDIKALYVGESRTDSAIGLVKMIVTDPQHAMRILRKEGLTVHEETVVVTALDDHPGGLAYILDILAAEELNIAHAYSFVSRIKGKALSVFCFSEPERARQVISAAGVSIIKQATVGQGSVAVPGEPDLSAYLGGVFYW